MSLAVVLGMDACTGGRDEVAPTAGAPGSAARSSPATTANTPAKTPGGTAARGFAGPVLSPSEQARVSAARKAAALGRVPIGRPLPQRTVAPMRDVRMSQTGTLEKDRATLRVVSARSDLTGQRELAWVADRGEPVGDAWCSQKIRLSNSAKAGVRRTLLICWRTSAEKSVYTVAVDLSGRPSRRRSVAAIEKRWSQLG